MSQSPDEILYPLLPGFHRQMDAQVGEPLRALLAVLEREMRLVDSSISRSYENWFIETCKSWVVPYIAELLAVKRLPTFGSSSFNQRTYVANILSYRRRKGASSLLPQLARDLTGWPTHMVEFFRLVETMQHLLQPKLMKGPVDLRDAQALRRLGGPFDTLSHVDEVRNIPSHSGRYNLPSIGLFLWRLRSYRVPKMLATAAVGDATGRRYTFDPLGRDIPLFNPDRTQPGVDPMEWDVPAALSTAVLREDLKLLLKTPPPPLHYFGSDPAVSVFVNGSSTAVLASQILIADLSAWSAPFDTAGTTYKIAIDPERGRLLFSQYAYPGSPPITKAEVIFNYGFSSELGGGPYDRLDPAVTPPAVNIAVSSRSVPPGGKTSLTAALTQLAGMSPAPTGVFVIELQDSERYTVPALITVPANLNLIIRAANLQRPSFVLDSSTSPSHTLTTPPDSGIVLGSGASLTLDGLLIGSGILRVYAGSSGSLSLRHTTLLPTADGYLSTAGQWPSVKLLAATASFSMSMDRCITGSLLLYSATTPLLSALTVTDSIIDGAGTTGTTLAADTLTIQRSTVMGSTTANLLPLAGDCIFSDVVQVARTQPGCVRFCYVPSNEPNPSAPPPRSTFSITPPRYRCQPDGALDQAQDLTSRLALRSTLKPIFNSTLCGQPSYLQLSFKTSELIRHGGSDGSELGAFFHLHQPQREGNITASLQEFLRFGYEAGVFFLN